MEDNANLAKEYYRLSKLSEPSDKDLEYITKIIELAQSNSELEQLLNDVDDLIAYENSLEDEEENY